MSPLFKKKITVREFAVTLFAEFKDTEVIISRHSDLAKRVGRDLFGNEVFYLKVFAVDVATSLGLQNSRFREPILDAFRECLREAFKEDPSAYPIICERIEQYDRAVRNTPPERMDPSIPVEHAAGKQFADFLGMKNDALVIAVGVSIFLLAESGVKQFIRNVKIV